MDNDLELSVCGIDCTQCPFLYALNNADMRERLAKKMNRPHEKCRCSGCRGDRSTHWSSSCCFLICCHDEKHLHNCKACQDFPCEPLAEFYKRDTKYQRAYERLKEMKSEPAN